MISLPNASSGATVSPSAARSSWENVVRPTALPHFVSVLLFSIWFYSLIFRYFWSILLASAAAFAGLHWLHHRWRSERIHWPANKCSHFDRENKTKRTGRLHSQSLEWLIPNVLPRNSIISNKSYNCADLCVAMIVRSVAGEYKRLLRVNNFPIFGWHLCIPSTLEFALRHRRCANQTKQIRIHGICREPMRQECRRRPTQWRDSLINWRMAVVIEPL